MYTTSRILRRLRVQDEGGLKACKVVVLGLYWDDGKEKGKETGNYYLGFRVQGRAPGVPIQD